MAAFQKLLQFQTKMSDVIKQIGENLHPVNGVYEFTHFNIISYGELDFMMKAFIQHEVKPYPVVYKVEPRPQFYSPICDSSKWDWRVGLKSSDKHVQYPKKAQNVSLQEKKKRD